MAVVASKKRTKSKPQPRVANSKTTTVTVKTKRSRRSIKLPSKITSAPMPKIYVVWSLITLALSTLWWSFVGAQLENSNADQFANTFLMENASTYAQASLPTQHTFLLKLPLFGMLAAHGATLQQFTLATVLLSLVTVGGFSYMLWRIERRPAVFATILLALAAVLVFIPAQSYPGSYLPANFAMVTTRNIEYLLYIAGLLAILTRTRFRSTRFILACLAFSLLFASDKLFVGFALGSGIIGSVIYLFTRHTVYLKHSLAIVVASVISIATSTIGLKILNSTHLLPQANGGSLGPYGLITSFKDAVIGSIYAVMSIFTNFGSNPAFQARIVTAIPSTFFQNILSTFGIGYLITLAITLAAIIAAGVTFIQSLKPPIVSKRKPKAFTPTAWPQQLSVFLLFSTVAAMVVFIVTVHYYPADSRYLTIALFAGFVALATTLTRYSPTRSQLLFTAITCSMAVLFGSVFQIHNTYQQTAAISNTSKHNKSVIMALKAHPVSTLVGNYWRVLPIKAVSPTTNIMPLENCSSPRRVLSSQAWQPNLEHHSFAYLLKLEPDIGSYPACSLENVVSLYGRPDSSIVIDGSRQKPQELLLFYDSGAHTPSSTVTINKSPLTATVLPVNLTSVSHVPCSGRTILQSVAHEDDDILFMNPDLQHEIQAGSCVRTVFFTAGDAGGDNAYWLSRQHGIEAAYNSMLNTPGAPWTERIVSLETNQIVTIANPRGNDKISLVFFHLPDGNPSGGGYNSQNYESLQKLYDGNIETVTNVEKNSTYTYEQLVQALLKVITFYNPNEIRTQSQLAGHRYHDHSDHTTVGTITTAAFDLYTANRPGTAITYYMGYPIHALRPNVESLDYDSKVKTFLAFSAYDVSTCQTPRQCNDETVYGSYLRRQYTSAE